MKRVFVKLQKIFSKFYIAFHQLVFTHSSKTNDSVSFNAYNDSHSALIPLENLCSQFDAELATIHYTLGYIRSLSTEY